MKNIFWALVAVLMAHSATAQEKYPQGLYMSFGEIVNKAPSMPADSVEIVKRTEADVILLGGNDYKLVFQSKELKKTLKKDVWAYSNGDSLYVNGTKFNVNYGYVRVIKDGPRHLLFDAAAQNKIISTSRPACNNRYHYALNKSTGKLHVITLKFIKKVLPDGDSDVYADFKKDMETMGKINNLNQKRSVECVITENYARLID